MFSKEEEMYPIIENFLKEKFKAVVVTNKIQFTMLKGWIIDVAGLVNTESGYESIIAVEAKKELTTSSFLQAISQAEMYQKVVSRAYIAFPEDEIKKSAKDKSNWNLMKNICMSKGIGILKVKKDSCDEILKPNEMIRNIDVYNSLINQFKITVCENMQHFGGFEIEDFEFFDGREEKREILKKKLNLLLKDVEQYLTKKRTEITSIDLNNLHVELGNFARDGAWCFVSQEDKNKLPKVAHYTLGV